MILVAAFLFLAYVAYTATKCCNGGSDGGPDSGVTGFWFVEHKSLFSIVVLHFRKGTRENYHEHAFHALTWFLGGEIIEEHLNGSRVRWVPSLWPKFTPRSTFHRVNAVKDTWALSIRGPWLKEWREYDPVAKEFIFLTNGRRVLEAK